MSVNKAAYKIGSCRARKDTILSVWATCTITPQ